MALRPPGSAACLHGHRCSAASHVPHPGMWLCSDQHTAQVKGHEKHVIEGVHRAAAAGLFWLYGASARHNHLCQVEIMQAQLPDRRVTRS